jgi:hypothetical protein
MKIETPTSESERSEFVLFHDTIYSGVSAAWSQELPYFLSVLKGEVLVSVERELQPFMVIDKGDVQARVLAVFDKRYIWAAEGTTRASLLV